jgi:hypothetical protein
MSERPMHRSSPFDLEGRFVGLTSGLASVGALLLHHQCGAKGRDHDQEHERSQSELFHRIASNVTRRRALALMQLPRHASMLLPETDARPSIQFARNPILEDQVPNGQRAYRNFDDACRDSRLPIWQIALVGKISQQHTRRLECRIPTLRIQQKRTHSLRRKNALIFQRFKLTGVARVLCKIGIKHRISQILMYVAVARVLCIIGISSQASR